jgi:hypothetical protein
MNDTPEAVQNLYRTLLLRRSGSERLAMGCAMFDTARALTRASFQETSPTTDDLRVRLFLRTYRGDFAPATEARIAAWFATRWQAAQADSANRR